MARVLIGWELGGNRGHASRITPAAAMLTAAGHDVALAVQRLDAFGTAYDTGVSVFQAPIWPGLLGGRSPGGYSTLTDILCRVGLSQQGVLGGLISGWESILSRWQPDLVIAEFAPALLCAARDRVATSSSGNGFVQPPATLPEMPRFAGPPQIDEAMLLDTIDAELRSAGREPLPALPALFAADHQLIDCFAETDPYRVTRTGPLCVPRLSEDRPEPGDGDEVFAYSFAQSPGADTLWSALATARKPSRACIPGASAETVARFKDAGIIVHTKPLAWADIVRRSRLIVSHGGHGMVSGALIAGLPHVIAFHDLEKQLNGDAVVAMGLGKSVARHTGDVAGLAAAIGEAYDDAAMAARAKVAAPGFRLREGPSYRERMMVLVASL